MARPKLLKKKAKPDAAPPIRDEAYGLPVGWQQVDSSNVDAIAYDAPKKALKVRFKGKDTVYTYDAVPPHKFRELMQAQSKGVYLHAEIYPNHKASKE